VDDRPTRHVYVDGMSLECLHACWALLSVFRRVSCLSTSESSDSLGLWTQSLLAVRLALRFGPRLSHNERARRPPNGGAWSPIIAFLQNVIRTVVSVQTAHCPCCGGYSQEASMSDGPSTRWQGKLELLWLPRLTALCTTLFTRGPAQSFFPRVWLIACLFGCACSEHHQVWLSKQV
jgi:hypothetical protein